MKPCNLYPGRIGSHGYGVLPGEFLAHRQAYADAHGVPLSSLKGLTVRHSCDVRACREPAHLSTGTHLDNMRDMRQRATDSKPATRGAWRTCRPRKPGSPWQPYGRTWRRAAGRADNLTMRKI